MSLVNAVKSLCAQYLFNQWLEFDQTSTDTSSGWDKEMFRFWWPWPYFQGHYIINTQKVSLVNAVRSLCAHCLFNQLLVLLDFGDLDFIFIYTLALWNLNFVRKRFYALCGGCRGEGWYRISAAYWQFPLKQIHEELSRDRLESLRKWSSWRALKGQVRKFTQMDQFICCSLLFSTDWGQGLFAVQGIYQGFINWKVKIPTIPQPCRGQGFKWLA